MDPEERVHWIYSSTSNDELSQRYDEWAKFYEADMINAFGYTAPADTLAAFSKYAQPEDRILDVGAGTGLMGLALYQNGYRHLVALDMSEAMLAEAAKKKVYTELVVGVLGEPLDLPTNSFDGMVSVGTFTLGHAPVTAFHELTRITKPGGYIVFSLNNALFDTFKPELDAIEAAGKWQLVEIGEKFYPMPIGEPDVPLQVLVYQVTSE